MSTINETPWDYVYSALFGNFAMDDETARVYADAVIEAFDGSSAFRIVPATAVRQLVDGASEGYVDLPAIDTLRAYIEEAAS